MSKHETWRTRQYWESVGGTLIEEYVAVNRTKTQGLRLMDGVIILGGSKEINQDRKINIKGKDIIIIQTKASRLGMYLLGQAFFSRELLKAHKPKSIRTVAICSKDDEKLRPIAEQYDIEVVVIKDKP